MKKNDHYWKSLEDLAKDPLFEKNMKEEFLSSPLKEQEGINRRDFLKLMGASLALASLSCARRPIQKIAPFSKRPENYLPGKSKFYASSFSDDLESFSVLVKVKDHRPIKLEGNPKHPLNKGALSVRAHGKLLNLYDPDRIKKSKQNLFNEKRSHKDEISINFSDFDKEVLEKLKGSKIALLTSSFLSPSKKRLVSDFKKHFSLKTYLWDKLDYSHVRESFRKSYGSSLIPQYSFDKSYYTLSLGADFLGTYLAPVQFTKDFSSLRKASKKMSKLLVFESDLSLTGSNADERYALSSEEILDASLLLASKVSEKLGKTSLSRFLKKKIKSYPINEKRISEISSDLIKNRSKSIVIAGGLNLNSLTGKNIHLVSHLLNSLLNNDGKTIDYKNSFLSHQGAEKNILKLIKDIERGKIETLLIDDLNPIYSSVYGERLKEALKKLKTSICFSAFKTETTEVCDYLSLIPHELESWSDLRWTKNLTAIRQPVIAPLYESRSFEDSLITWMNKSKRSFSFKVDSFYDYLKRYSKTYRKNKSWSSFLKEGFVNSSQSQSLPARNFNYSYFYASLSSLKRKKLDYELSLYPSMHMASGNLSNVSWLQEFPDPLSKICWDNYLNISYNFAKKHKLKEGQMMEIERGEIKKSYPVHIQPGMNENSLSLAIGYGRKVCGSLGENIGFYALNLLEKDEFSGLSFKFKVLNSFYRLANVQSHHSMEKRPLALEASLKDYLKDKKHLIHRHKVFSLWDKHKYTKEKWGMSIDLNTCTGCGSCVLACQSENNIPVVGKKNVLKGREMHWIRVDRYYKGDVKKPNVVHQPVTCMHCDNAPCETVCPVLATVQSDEGTNDMIYNRCVGTRYCSNNCPYKVRRFNWFDYTSQFKSPLHLSLNPDVTVRSRGVMEKCTFCIHRIKDKRAEALSKKEKFKADSVKVACQQSCPADAIQFGDLNDPKSQVSKDFKKDTNYFLLEELNTKPALSYGLKIRNTKHFVSSKKERKH